MSERAGGSQEQALLLEALPYAAAIVAKRKQNPGRVELRPLETEQELRAFVEQTFGVNIPDVQVCENHSTPWRAFKSAYFAERPGSVWKASRGFGGKTTLEGLLVMTEALTLGIGVNVLGGSGRQSKRVLDAMRAFWEAPNAPRHMLQSEVKSETTLTNGATIEALLASMTSVRGPHPTRLRLDEVDEMEREVFDSAAPQPMEKKGIRPHIVASSTEQYADGTFAYVRDFAEEKAWDFHEWCLRETTTPHGWNTPESIAWKEAMTPRAIWLTEIIGQRPDPSLFAIQPDCVERMFRPELGTFDGSDEVYIELEPPDPLGLYAHGADWAQSVHYTDIWTIRYDRAPARLVAYQRKHKVAWPIMTGLLDERFRRFGGTSAHDETGLGRVISGILETPAEGIWLEGHKRYELFSQYIVAIEQGKLISPDIACVRKEHKTASRKQIYGTGHPPDSFVAGALAWRATRLAPSMDIPRLLSI